MLVHEPTFITKTTISIHPFAAHFIRLAHFFFVDWHYWSITGYMHFLSHNVITCSLHQRRPLQYSKYGHKIRISFFNGLQSIKFWIPNFVFTKICVTSSILLHTYLKELEGFKIIHTKNLLLKKFFYCKILNIHPFYRHIFQWAFSILQFKKIKKNLFNNSFKAWAIKILTFRSGSLQKGERNFVSERPVLFPHLFVGQKTA